MNDGLGQNPTQTWPVPRFAGKTRKAWLIVDGSASGLTILDQWPSGSFVSSGTGSYSTTYTPASGLFASQNATMVRCSVSGNAFNCQARATLNAGATQLTVETYANSATPGSVGGPVYIEFWA